MGELTYILGAGASYQSIPVVKTFGNRFRSFVTFLNQLSSFQTLDKLTSDRLKDVYELSRLLSISFESHQSFDTYFKKLFHTKEHRKVKEAKKILNLYFTWEHLTSITNKPEYISETTFWKQSIIDKRYDALIAGLLKPIEDKSEPYCKVNFISWNYDLNLLMSLKNYFSPNETINKFLTSIDKNDNVWCIEDQITIINMNGYFYNSAFNDFINLDKQSIQKIFTDKINEDYFNEISVDDDAELIKFAWEKGNSNVILAKSKIDQSDNIVVIGYTFPLYNRLIDFEYLNRANILKKKIIIQDPNAIVLRQNMIDNYQIYETNSTERDLKAVIDCDSFYIPSTIFGVNENTGEYYFV